MDLFQAIMLGIIQGATEFLPVSSSGHLIIAREIFGWETANSLSFDIWLHVATACAVVIYFRKDILRLIRVFAGLSLSDETGDDRKLFLAIIIGTIPAVFAGLLWEDMIETSFRSARLVAVVLILGSALMAAAEYFSKKKQATASVSARNGFIVGAFQALALIPGVSRSGSTISGGLLVGLKREAAVRFSFLLSVPIIIGAALKKLLEADTALFLSFEPVFVAGAAAAFAIGFASVHFLTMYLRTRTFAVFIWYRVALAVALLALL